MPEPLDELRAALGAIEPSLGFEQRTLRHIADSRTSRARRWRGMFAVPAAALTVLAVIVSSRTAKPVGGLGDQTALPRLTPVSAPLVRVDAPFEHPTEPAPRPVRRVRSAPTAWTIPENAHADQALAVRRLIALMRAGAVLGAPDETRSNDSELIAIPAIDVKPIVIAPLAAGQGGGSER